MSANTTPMRAFSIQPYVPKVRVVRMIGYGEHGWSRCWFRMQVGVEVCLWGEKTGTARHCVSTVTPPQGPPVDDYDQSSRSPQKSRFTTLCPLVETAYCQVMQTLETATTPSANCISIIRVSDFDRKYYSASDGSLSVLK